MAHLMLDPDGQSDPVAAAQALERALLRTLKSIMREAGYDAVPELVKAKGLQSEDWVRNRLSGRTELKIPDLEIICGALGTTSEAVIERARALSLRRECELPFELLYGRSQLELFDLPTPRREDRHLSAV